MAVAPAFKRRRQGLFGNHMAKTTKELIDIVNKAEGQLLLQILGKTKSNVRTGLSSGSLNLNYALSGNPLVGYVWGRIVEIAGEEASGKTTIALHAVKEAQKKGIICAYLDVEHSMDPEYAATIGVDLDELAFSQPDWGEQAITVARLAVEQGARLIVVDSVAALIPKVELEGETGDAFMGKQARLMGQAMRQLAGKASKAQAILIFINQLRMKIGVFFGDPTTTTGGKALKFAATYRLFLSSPRSTAEKEKVDGEMVETGIDVNINVRKNKVYPPYRKATVHIEYGKGIDLADDAANFLLTRVGDGAKVTLSGKSYGKAKLIEGIGRDAKLRGEIGKVLQGFGK